METVNVIKAVKEYHEIQTAKNALKNFNVKQATFDDIEKMSIKSEYSHLQLLLWLLRHKFAGKEGMPWEKDPK
jgi:hypothetical protein